MIPEHFGQLFVFEGADGVGKSSLSKGFAARLLESGIRCEWLAFPGALPNTLGQHIYHLHHEPSRFNVEAMSPTAKQLLHIAAHVDAIESRIIPLLRDGVTVVLDRFWWSAFVYGIAGGASPAVIQPAIDIELAAWSPIVPTAAFLVRRESPLRPEPADLWPRWRTLYDELAHREGEKHLVHVIENDSSEEEALARIVYLAQSGIGVTQRVTEKVLPEPQLSRGLFVFSSLAPAQPTKVFESYWFFAAERQAIFFRRLRGLMPPWTTDTVLAQHKFTNAYRASDRVSQFLIRSVAYEGDMSPEELFFRIIFFKIFNRIETWELMRRSLGHISYATYSFEAYDGILSKALAAGETIYSSAYIMPTGNRIFGTTRKHQANLRLIERMMDDEVPLRLQDTRSMADAFRLLRSYPMLGDFLAFQYVIDLNYSTLTHFSEMDFVVPGPGARDGIAKCFSSIGGLSEADLIKVVADRQEQELAERGIDFQTLWGRRLQLIDCQNLFCEVDKYARVRHPDVLGRQARIRIKHKFSPKQEPIDYWYPPKWGLNDRIAAECRAGEENGVDS